MKNLIMTSSTSHSKNNMGDEFYSILKLVSGEEIFAMVCVDESDDDPILILHNPIKMKPLNQLSQLSYIKVTPWMEMTEEDMFVMKMDKVITMTECRDQKLIKIYKQYVEEKDSDEGEVIASRSKKGKVKLSGDPRLGYISSVEKKRQSLEDPFKSDSKESLNSLQTSQRLLYTYYEVLSSMLSSSPRHLSKLK